MKKTAEQLDDAEQREILATIARDREAYPRDRIAAIRALRELALEKEPANDGDIYPPDDLSRRRASRRP